MTIQETKKRTPEKEKSAMKPANDESTGKTSWKGKRGKLLQETGIALLSEPGTEKDVIKKLLEEKRQGS